MHSELNNKANSTDVYTKNESNDLLNEQLNASTFSDGVALKANITDVYYKSDLSTKQRQQQLIY